MSASHRLITYILIELARNPNSAEVILHYGSHLKITQVQVVVVQKARSAVPNSVISNGGFHVKVSEGYMEVAIGQHIYRIQKRV